MLFSFLAALSLAIPAKAHEFWLSPTDYQVAPGTPIVAHIRIGQDFDGPAFSYLPRNFFRFDIVSGETIQAVQGRMGDRPALNQPAPKGLAILVHETTDRKLTYKDFALFQRFATHKDAKEALTLHKTRGLPEVGFSETYRRFAKSLVAVGDGAGSDRALGLEVEIVALANPYTETLTELPVQVLYNGAPRAGAQLEVFAKSADKTVTITRQKLDSDGRALVPLTPETEYLLDSVVLKPLPNDDPAAGPVWRSLWASLTFRTP